MILAHGDNFFFSPVCWNNFYFSSHCWINVFFCPSPVFTVSQNIFQFCCFWITKFKFVIHLLNWAWGDTEAISYLVSQVCFQTCWKLPFRLRIRLLLIIVHARVWFLANFMNWNHQLHTGDREGCHYLLQFVYLPIWDQGYITGSSVSRVFVCLVVVVVVSVL